MEGNREILFNRYRVSVSQDENIQRINCTTMFMYFAQLNRTLKKFKVINFVSRILFYYNVLEIKKTNRKEHFLNKIFYLTPKINI